MLLSYKFPTKIPMADIIRFAISSAMRQAEITRIDHATFNEKARTILITDRKHPTKKIGNHKTVPLLAESVDLIKAQPIAEGDTRVFPYRSETLGEYFRAACKKLGIVDLHFHDLRHLGTTRLFQMGYKIDEVQMFTGHEDWKMLQRYTHLKAENVRRFETPKAVKPVAFEMDDATMEQFKMFQAMQAMMRKKAA
jgi:integrase